MADSIDKPSSATANKTETKVKGKFKRLFPGWLKRPKSANRSASQPNSTRGFVSSASGPGDLGRGDEAESAEPTASGSNGALHQAVLGSYLADQTDSTYPPDPSAPFRITGSPSVTVSDLPGSVVVQEHGGDISRALTPTAPPASPNPQIQVTDWKTGAKESLGVASRFTQTLLKKVPDCVDGNPVKMAFAIAKAIIEIKDTVGDNKDKLEQHLKKTANRLLAVEMAVVNGVPKAAKQAMEKFKETLREEMKELQGLSGKWLATQILDNEDYKKRIQLIFQRVEDATTSFQVEMMISIQNEMSQLQEDSKKVALERLRPSNKADHKTLLEEQALKREECTPGTRVKILEDITNWANNSSSESPRVFWLTGQAGSGKTTIAYTIAKLFEKVGDAEQQTVLGGNFLCSRQFDETRQQTRIVPTIAYQLARKCKPYADALHAADKFDAVNHNISTQLKDLLVEPWQQLEAPRDQQQPSYLIVVDALDEIEDDGGSAFLGDLLAAINEYDLKGFKFLVTSRSHPEIVTLCKSFASEAVLWLQQVPIEEAELDIGTYLKTKLPKLAGNPELAELGRRTNGLFIYAATAVKHLTRSRSITGEEQAKMLKKLLSHSRESAPASKTTFLIDELYQQIMHETFSKYDDDEILTRRLQILYTFLCTAERTSTSVVAALVVEGDNDDTRAAVKAVVEDLHAVLYTQDDRVFWYHASFPDFIFDPTRSNFHVGENRFEFSCNEPTHHHLLGESCFRVMSELWFNMGDIPSSFLFDSDDTDALSEKVNTNISNVLRYSCHHWTHHLPSPQLIDTENLLRCISDFLQIRVLFWIEAMNLLGFSNQCTQMLQRARQWVLKRGDSYLKLASDVGEAANFATYFTGSPAAKSTPHLYISALATWLHNTSLCRNWKKQFARIPIFTHTKGSVNLPLMTIPTKSAVKAVAFSSDGTRIVSSSYDRSVRVWDASTGAQLTVLKKHTSIANSVAFSSDGTRIVSGLDDKSVRVWDASTGAQLNVLKGHTGAVNSVAFSVDGTRIVSGSYDKSVRVWDASMGAELNMLEGHTSAVNSVAFSSDGTRIVSGSYDESVRMWDASTGVQLNVLKGHTSIVKSVAFSSDGTRIVSGSHDKSVWVWDASTGAQLSVLKGHTSAVCSVAFSSDGTQIVSCSYDHSVRVWDASTGAQLNVLEGHTSAVYSVSFSSDGTRIVSGSDDKSVRVWNVPMGAELNVLKGHTGMVNSVAFSSDGTRIVSGSHDKSVRVWDASTGAELNVLKGHTNLVNSVAFSNDATRIASGSDDESVCVWDVSTAAQLNVLKEHTGAVCSVAFSSDGTRIVSGSYDKSVRVWDASTGAQLNVLKGHTGAVNSVAFSGNRTRIISGSHDESVRVWDALTGAELNVLKGHTSIVNSVAFSSGATRIVSCSYDESVRVWDALTGAQLNVLKGHTSIVKSVAFSSDGMRIVSGSHDKSVRVWDASTGAELNVLKGHTSIVNSVAFSSDGTRIVSGSHDESVQVWDASTSAVLNVLKGHTRLVNSVAFSGDSTGIVSDSYGESVWDVSRGAERNILKRHSGMVNSILFSSDGVRIVSGSDDESVEVWNVPIGTKLNALKGHTKSVNPATLLSDGPFTWNLSDTNWIIDSLGQSYLMWVPQEAQVTEPSSILVISCHGSSSVDFRQSMIGDKWIGCYTP